MYEQLISIMIFNLAILAIAFRGFKKRVREDVEDRDRNRKEIKELYEEQKKLLEEENTYSYTRVKGDISAANLLRFNKVEGQLREFIKWNNKNNKKKTDQSRSEGDSSSWLHNDISNFDYYRAEEEKAIKEAEKLKSNGKPML